MEKNRKMEQPQLTDWLSNYIRDELISEFFPEGITQDDIKDIKLFFEAKRNINRNQGIKISIESITEKAMKIDPDKLEATDIVELVSVFQKLDRLRMAEMVDDLERSKLLDKVNLLLENSLRG